MVIHYGQRKRWLARTLVVGIGVLMAAALAPRGALAADTEQVTYSFCATGGTACTDGKVAAGVLIMDKSGNLYGVTLYGGAHGNGGTVFELVPNSNKTAYTEKVLYSFCSTGGSACTDGAYPVAGLIVDASGNLYGMTDAGGAHGNASADTGGTVFELTPNADKTAYTHKLLYSFCSTGGTSCTDGQSPEDAPIMDSAGNLYGTTQFGGAHGKGTVFELMPNSKKTAYTQKLLYSFCSTGGTSCTDGSLPAAGLIMDKSGNLYGTTNTGGANGKGTVFELTPNSNKTAFTHKLLYSFCATGGTSCTDGEIPAAGLLMDSAGNLYGTADLGGAHGNASQGTGGAVFELLPNASKTAFTYKTLYSFCATGGTNCTDGTQPNGGVIMNSSGNLYGTTYYGGAHGSAASGGTAFELTPNSKKTAYTQKLLYSFCATGGTNCTDGGSPNAALIMNSSGDLLGTTSFGGAHNQGTVFELKP